MRSLATLLPLLAAGALQGCPDVVNSRSECFDLGTCPPEAYEQGGSGAAGSDGKGGSTTGKGGSSGSSAGGEGAAPVAGQGGDGATAGDGGNGPLAGAGGTSACSEPCAGDTPLCDDDSGECVECLEHGDCGAGDTPYCDGDHTCVECLGHDDCAEETASQCDAGQCVGCESNAQCTHLAGTTVCDTGANECVECTTDHETPCGDNSCNPATLQCTGTERGTVEQCKPCLADSECVGGDQADPDFRCVPMEFDGTLRPGGFCLRRASKTCGRPYMIAVNAASLSGAAAENYCGIDQDNVRCEAVVDLEDSRTCAGAQLDSQCGCARDQDGNCTEAGQGGLCRDFTLVDDRCTYQCGVDDDCPTGRTCSGSPTSFCQ